MAWKHKKRGTYYSVIAITQKGHVLYMSHADRKIWARPVSEFFDGRFTFDVTVPSMTQEEMGINRG